MGYTITIGDGFVETGRDDFPELYCRWAAKRASDTNAPQFENDEMTGNGNSRSPSYSTWSAFCKDTGLYDTFYDSTNNLIGGHPGAVGITPEMAKTVADALEKRLATATAKPGFSDWHQAESKPAEFDAHLARLIWLDWWIRWAIERFETPVIANT